MQTNTNNIRVSVFPELVRADMKVTQNDIDTNEVIVRVFDQSDVEIDYATITSALIIFTKPDYHVVQGNMTVREADLYYKMGTNEIAVKGDVKAQIQLIGSSGERLTIGGFSFTVQTDPVAPWTVQSSSEYGILRSLIVEAQAAINDVDALSLWENYNPTKPYIPLNKVVYNGSCYINFVACQGVLPTDASKWLCIASKGDTGAAGIAATITVGTVTTGAAGTSASVSNVGTPSDAVFNFKIPKGDKGEKGDKGNDGVNGINGVNGQDGHTPIKGTDYFDGADGVDGIDAFVYIAYASDNTGTGFSLTPTDSLKYRAEIHVDTEIVSPQSSDFTGAVWVKYIGDDGADGEGGGSSSGTKTARFVIGTSTSGWTSNDCNYLCDGTTDDVEINAAITALPVTGGEIVILDGTYNITAKIDVNKSNVSIRGNGNATILKRMWDSGTYDPIEEEWNGDPEGVIHLEDVSGCKIENLQTDGNKINYTSWVNFGIYLDSSSNNTITGNTWNSNRVGISLVSSSDNAITGNKCDNNLMGIYLDSSSNNTITGNKCDNNMFGIFLGSSSNNTVTGNTCNSNESGISLDSSSNNTVTGNTCNNNEYGIDLSSSTRY